jgi:ABC-type sugar transport system ATPase subunit
MIRLRLENVTKSFNEVIALKNVTLEIKKGEFCVILGPSGCGKSTLLRIIAGLIPQDKGRIFFDDMCVDELSPKHRDVAMVFQNYALYPHMSVKENLSFGLRMRNVPRKVIEEKVMETANLLRIGHLLHRRPSQLSGGQRQRVAMGRALVRNPRLFLFDEPLSNLDARLRSEMRVELKRLHKIIKTTTLYVTHDQVEAMSLGEKIVVMSNGMIHQVGKPETIYSRPADEFVAGFIGSPTMNILTGSIKEESGRTVFHSSGLKIPLDLRWAHLKGKDVKLGIRPEDIVFGSGKDSIDIEPEIINNLGSDTYIHGKIAGHGITIRIPKGRSISLDQKIKIYIDPSKVHIFHEGVRVE